MRAHDESTEKTATQVPKPERREVATDADRVVALQRTIGNAAVAGLLADQETGGTVRRVLSGTGRPLDAPVRQDMESRLGADFSGVRVHTGSAAAESAEEIGARAYTSGDHIVIGRGGGDRHTLAHELTHVIQQRQGSVPGHDHGDGLRISDPSDAYEQAAEANATRALAEGHTPGTAASSGG